MKKDIWQPTPDSLNLSHENIDVWLCDLKKLSKNIDEFYSVLSEDEQERADKLKIEDKRQQYIITRGSLRKYLGLLTEADPAVFKFKYLKHGKPVLEEKPQYADISFNVSHSNDIALVAISQKHNIGIDVEKINYETDHQALVTRFFSKAEQSEFNNYSESSKAKAFCACWTRKEAFIKATGDGVTYGLESFDVSVDPEVQQPTITLHKASTEVWSALNLPINDDYMACLVHDADKIKVRCWR
ncbi:MAG: 4'-phosphopantetheinyl transferase [Gammaproteobacteria bacterium]